MQKKILIMGLPGSGKTTLANKLVPMLNAVWLNADEVRKSHNDWDFSAEGRTTFSCGFRTICEVHSFILSTKMTSEPSGNL